MQFDEAALAAEGRSPGHQAGIKTRSEGTHVAAAGPERRRSRSESSTDTNGSRHVIWIELLTKEKLELAILAEAQITVGKANHKIAALTAESVESYLNLIGEVRRDWKFKKDDPGGPWYRGQQRKHWHLVPNIARIGCFDRETEDKIREEFATQAPALSGSETLPTNEWDLYFLMQHYGAPTRLIGWRKSDHRPVFRSARQPGLL